MDDKKFTIELAVPKSISILESTVAEEVLARLKSELVSALEPQVTEIARRIVAEKLGLTEKQAVGEAKPSADDALRELNIALARGNITKEEYLRMKADLTSKKACKKCGKEIESGANFCRFCGAKQ